MVIYNVSILDYLHCDTVIQIFGCPGIIYMCYIHILVLIEEFRVTLSLLVLGINLGHSLDETMCYSERSLQ